MNKLGLILEEAKYLTEAGIKIPKGTKAAKIIYHEDLDGVFSAILAYKQLIKQGIPAKNIKITSIQYGFRNERVIEMMKGKKGQMIVLVDFSRLPPGAREPDFWSDHHDIKEGIEEASIISNTVKEKIEKWKPGVGKVELKQIMDGVVRNKPKKDTPEERVKFREAMKKYGMSSLVKTKKPKDPKALKYFDFFTLALNVKPGAEKEKRKTIRAEIEGERPFSKVKSSGAIGRTHFGSEAEHLATVSAKGLADSTSIKAITGIDSAKYTNLENVLDMAKNFRDKGRMERLATITNSLVSQLIKKNPAAVRQLIKTTSPSLVNLYNNVLKISKVSDKQAEAIKEFSKEKPDWAKIDQIRGIMPSKEMARDITKSGKIRELAGLKELRKKGEEDIKKHTLASTTGFKGKGAVIVQSTTGKGQPSRFLGSLLTKQDNTRYAALLREWPTMFQIALNPDLPKEIREKINFPTMVNSVINKVKAEMGKRYENWAFDIIQRESGGHTAIASVSGLGTLGLMPKKMRDKFKELQALNRRVKTLSSKKKMEDIMPQKAALLKSLEADRERYAERRKQIIAVMKKLIIEEANKQLSGAVIPGIERFKGKRG